MKSIRFLTLKILSYKERRARIINLNNDLILVKGKNRKGKSCILKSIYRALGAEIRRYPSRWSDANTILLLVFTIDGIKFKSLLIGNDYYVFNPDGSLRFGAKIGSKKYTQKINELFDLQLYLGDTKIPEVPIGAICMPFYIDQDDGWDECWTSFAKIGNNGERSNYRQYLTNVVNETYFQKKSELTKVESLLVKLRTENKAYQNIVLDVKRQYHVLGVQMSVEGFKNRTDIYLDQLTRLREEQNEILRSLHSLYTRRSYVEVNIEQLKRNIKDIEKDFNFALHQDNIITCPTCGGRYENNMLTRHEILRDKNACKNQVILYEKELDSLDKQIKAVTERFKNLNENIAVAQNALKEKDDNVSLDEVIEDKVREKLLTVIAEKKEKSQIEINSLHQKKTELESSIKLYENSGRKDLINETFINYVQKALYYMGGITMNEKSIHFGGRITATGSSKPIHIIANMFAYLHIIKEFGGPVFMPVVIDEPKQQGLTTEGLNKMLKFMESADLNSQLIVSLAEDNVTIPERFNVIDMNDWDRVLSDVDYHEVLDEIESLLDKTLFAVQ